MQFRTFKTAVAAQFALMQNHPLFRVAIDKDLLYQTYLASFPEGTDPLFRERTEHDCSCCKSFIRNAGTMVAVINNKIHTIWDVTVANEPAYQAVADAMAKLVKSCAIEDIFLNPESHIGTDRNIELINGNTRTWEHFYISLPRGLVVTKADIPSKLANVRTTKEMMLRALTDISTDAVDTVLELMAQNSLYRGSEKKHLVVAFQKLQKEFAKVAETDRDVWAWLKAKTADIGVARIRGDVVGTLLEDLSGDKELADAIGAWNFKMAPQNYQQPTDTLVTKKQIEAAYAQVEEMGFMPSMDRRHAVIGDITINNVLFADRSVRAAMGGNIFTDLVAATPSNVTPKLDGMDSISIDDFITNVLTLPTTQSVEVLFENRLAHSMVSLIAPVHADAPTMFKWPNAFNWMYDGNVADAIKERVKKAGGKVEGDLLFRLAWDNTDDLDAHCHEPKGGTHINYTNRRERSRNGGILDLDANGADGQRTDPAENIYYADRKTMKDGEYSFDVHQYSKNARGNEGFTAELEFDGQIHRFRYDQVMTQGKTVRVVTVRKTGNKFEIVSSIASTSAAGPSKTVWGLPTQTFHKVSGIMYSPNYWDGREEDTMGNRHIFFMLQGCVREGEARGFLNEHLNGALTPHRKVMQLVGSKMKVAESPDQLSGIGISTTQPDQYIVVKVTGKTSRMLKVTF